MRRHIRAAVTIAAVTIAALLISGTAAIAAPAHRHHNWPDSHDVGNYGHFADNPTSGLGYSGGLITNRISGNDILWGVRYNSAGTEYWLEDPATGNCLDYDASDVPFYHEGACGVVSGMFASLSAHAYSEQENKYTGNCMTDDGSGGNAITDSACSGSTGADRILWDINS